MDLSDRAAPPRMEGSPGREPALIAEDGERQDGPLAPREGAESSLAEKSRMANVPVHDESDDTSRSGSSSSKGGGTDGEEESDPGLRGGGQAWGVPPKEVRLPFTNESVLGWILAPHSPDDFLASVWERRPLHIEHSDAAYFAEVMTFEDLEDVLINSFEDEEFGEMLTFKDQQQVYYDNAFRAYLDGASVVVNHMDKEWPPVNALCQALGHHFPHAFANMYLTPPDSQAVHPHSDDRDVLLLQVWGHKKWRVYGSPQVLPYTDEQVGKSGARLATEDMGDLSLDCVVRQGDVLYIPRGFVHEARAEETTGSLHITVAIPTQDFTWAVAMLDAVKAQLRRPPHERWRRCVPTRLLPGGQTAREEAAWRQQLQDLVAAAVRDLSLETVRGTLQHRMARHSARQRAALGPQARGGSHVRFDEGLLLTSHLRPVCGMRYTLLEPRRAGTPSGCREAQGARGGGGRGARGAAGNSKEEDEWLTAIFQDALGKQMHWRIQVRLVNALHFCFSTSLYQKRISMDLRGSE